MALKIIIKPDGLKMFKQQAVESDAIHYIAEALEECNSKESVTVTIQIKSDSDVF